MLKVLIVSAFVVSTSTISAYATCGTASTYGSENGSQTASGEHFRPMGMTAASKTLPLGSVVTVTNKHNGRSVTVRINDRGPYVGGRILDLSTGAARAIGMNGLASVCYSEAKRTRRHG